MKAHTDNANLKIKNHHQTDFIIVKSDVPNFS